MENNETEPKPETAAQPSDGGDCSSATCSAGVSPPLIIKGEGAKCELWIQRDFEQSEIYFTVTGEEISNKCQQLDFKTVDLRDIDLLIGYLVAIKKQNASVEASPETKQNDE